MTIVCGPPLAGKSTYAEQHRAPDDIIIDLDEIRERTPGIGLSEAFRRRDARLRRAAEREVGVWLIICAPLTHQRDAMRDGLKPGRIVVLETPEVVCMERARDDYRGDIAPAIERWWGQYECDPRDDVVVIP